MLSSLPQWGLLILGAFYARTLLRGKASEAVEILQRANDVLSDRVAYLEKERGALGQRVAELEAKTDYTLVMTEHEKHAQQRHDGTVKAMEAITQRLERLAA